MDVKIIGSHETAVLKHDVFGSCYFAFGGKLYLLGALTENDGSKAFLLPIKTEVMLDVNPNNVDYFKGTIQKCSTSLKEKVSKEVRKEQDIQVLNDFFPEKKYFLCRSSYKKEVNIFNEEDSDNENDGDDCGHDDDLFGGFEFYGFNEDLMIEECIETVPCNYDTLVAKGDKSSKNFIFFAESHSCKNAYRITIFTSGEFVLNVVGTETIGFKLVISPKGRLVLEKTSSSRSTEIE